MSEAAIKKAPGAARITPAGPGDIDAARALFREYEKAVAAGAAQCFADFEKELAGLPGDCAPPLGGILLARDAAGAAIGVVAFHPLEPGVAEIKRLYLKPQHRGRGLGRQLMDAALRAAAGAGHRAVRLGTVPKAMHAADALYQSMGFRQIPAYAGSACAAACYETAL
jgi:putative acetyltransferase